MAEVNVDIKQGELGSAYIEAPFDKGKEALESKGYRIISLEENAGLRIQEGKDSFISRNGNWTREGVIYVPKKGIFLTKNSPIMDNAKEATDCHRNGKGFYLTDSQVERALEDSVKLKKKSIPTNRFKDNKIAIYAFGNYAEKYGQFLRNAGIKEMSVWLEDMQDKPFARQLWFWDINFESDRLDVMVFRWLHYDIEFGSVLNGCGRCHSNGRVRGVCGSAESTAKNSEYYSPNQIADALKDLGFSGLEKRLVEKLR